jgi:ATP-dependent Clp protease adaptor protein ClpS
MSEKTAIREKVNIKVNRPKLYKVIMHNDDYTTMEFVVDILMKVFNKSASEATKVMLDVHKRGSGIAGIYPYDIAVTKVSRAQGEAREKGFPLKLSLKEE